MDECVLAYQYFYFILTDHNPFKNCTNEALLGIGR